MDSHFASPLDRFFRRKKLDTDLDLRKIAKSLNEFYKKGCQEKSFPLDRTPKRFLSRDPAHCL
jgi:hypothetical protein